MEKFKWTPGPWKISLTDDTFVRSADNDVAVMIGDYSDDVTSLIMTANANLTAAAPDMYEALRIVSALQAAHPEVLAVVDAAMRKARGE